MWGGEVHQGPCSSVAGALKRGRQKQLVKGGGYPLGAGRGRGHEVAMRGALYNR